MKQCANGFYSFVSKGQIVKRKRPTLEGTNYQIILPLRALLLKRRDLKEYKKIAALSSNSDLRSGGAREKQVEEEVVKILSQFKVHEADAEFVHKICGICDTNSFNLSGPDGAEIMGLFPGASMMMHSCIKNTRLTFRSECILNLTWCLTLSRQLVVFGSDSSSHEYKQRYCFLITI